MERRTGRAGGAVVVTVCGASRAVARSEPRGVGSENIHTHPGVAVRLNRGPAAVAARERGGREGRARQPTPPRPPRTVRRPCRRPTTRRCRTRSRSASRRTCGSCRCPRACCRRSAPTRPGPRFAHGASETHTHGGGDRLTPPLAARVVHRDKYTRVDRSLMQPIDWHPARHPPRTPHTPYRFGVRRPRPWNSTAPMKNQNRAESARAHLRGQRAVLERAVRRARGDERERAGRARLVGDRGVAAVRPAVRLAQLELERVRLLREVCESEREREKEGERPLRKAAAAATAGRRAGDGRGRERGASAGGRRAGRSEDAVLFRARLLNRLQSCSHSGDARNTARVRATHMVQSPRGRRRCCPSPRALRDHLRARATHPGRWTMQTQPQRVR